MSEEKATDPEGRKPVTRRWCLKAGCSAVAAGLAACVAPPLYATQIEPHWIEVTHPDVHPPLLPAPLDGLTIAQLSDLHLGPHVTADDVRRSVELTNRQQADLVVLTGDFVYQSARYSEACARELASLRAPHGTYAVLGNHDVWTDADEVAGHLSDAGIAVLRDSRLSVDIGGAHLWLLGIEDTGHTGGRFEDFRALWQASADRLDGLLEGIPTEDARLLLVHNPDFTEMLPAERIDLALCGHTHGGQVRLPLLGPPLVPSCFGQTYAAGLVDGPHTRVYVNRGIGLISPAVRFNCRPEITVLRLT
jgi:hypothetical protein